MYKTLNQHYKEKFGSKVYKLSINGGFTCPNRDGNISSKGCIFCSKSGSGEFTPSVTDVKEMLHRAKKYVEHKNKSGKYIAYFQAFTNTYAPLERLKELFYSAIEPEYIVGLSVATRPDCLPEETLRLLSEINKIKPVSVELGLQTIKEDSVKYIRRGYLNDVYFEKVKRLKELEVDVVTHIIIGLPHETKNDAINTTEYAIKAGTDGIKFHLLYVLKGTDLEKDYSLGKFKCLEMEEYAEILKACIKILPPEIVVHRITGDGHKKDLVAPLWSADKKKVLNYLNKYLKD